jgi:hypothetical protein
MRIKLVKWNQKILNQWNSDFLKINIIKINIIIFNNYFFKASQILYKFI